MVADVQSCGQFYVFQDCSCAACSAKRKGLGEVQQVVIGPLWGAMTYACDKEWEVLGDPAHMTVKQSKGN